MYGPTLSPADFARLLSAISNITDGNAAANTVPENSSVGTLVGFTAVASDGANTITYSLDDNDGGRFAINSSTGVVTVAGPINFETDGATRSVTVRATSSGGSSKSATFTIGVTNVWEPSDPGSGVIQYALDGGAVYESTTINSLQPLRALEPYGTYRRPRQGHCWLFDGTNDYASLGARLTSGSPTALTVAAWVKIPNADVGERTVACEWNTGSLGWNLYVYQGKAQFGTASDGSTALARTSNALINDGAWHHIAAVYSAGTVTLYIDGSVAASTGTVAATLYNTSASLILGARTAGAGGFFNSSMYDVRVYNVAKSATEVAAIKNQASTPTTIDRTGLLAGYWCNNNAGNFGYDWSGNGKHLTLTNITASTFFAADTGVLYSPANQLGHAYSRNIVKYSEDFTNAIWSLSNVNLTANTVANPVNSAVTASKITPTVSPNANSHFVQQVAYVAGTIYTITVYAKAAGYNFLTISDGGGNTYSHFNLANGTVSSTSSTSPGNNITTTITDAGGGWYRCQMTFLASTTGFRFYFSSSATVYPSYAGDGTSGVYLYGVQIDEGLTASSYVVTTSVPHQGIVPRNEASTANDVLGATLQYTGLSPHPFIAETPCITGDGTAAVVGLGTGWFPEGTANSFTKEFWYYHNSNGSAFQRILDVRDSGNTDILAVFSDFNNGAYGAGGAGLYVQGATSSSTVSSTGAFTNGAWHRVVLSRSGSTFTLTVYAVSGASVSITRDRATALAATMYTNYLGGFGNAPSTNGSDRCQGRICNLAFTKGGVTKYVPGQSGPGSSNTNRDLFWIGSDGTYGNVGGAIINGTVANIWANRCPGYVQDWCINYGGGLNAAGAFVPGQISGTLCADGSAKSLTAGNHGNVYSRLVPNNWSAPELINIGYTSSIKLAPADPVQSISPADTKFRHNGASGSNKYFAVPTALTGSQKTDAQAYVA